MVQRKASLMVAALANQAIPVGYFLFGGEQHGFRRADNIRRAPRRGTVFLCDACPAFWAALLVESRVRPLRQLLRQRDR
jgi:hypothetical protein